MASIIELLEAKHAKDVFVGECKTGRTWGGAPLRLDAWAMTRSWVRLKMTGYEIKESRGDFLRDEKWHGYRQYCHELSFVCPHGLIKPDELPADIGLLYASKTKTRLFTKKKAARREIEIPVDVLLYVLMSRATIVPQYQIDAEARRDYWRRWMERKRVDQEFGHMVGKGIQQRVREEIEAVQRENGRLKRENDRFGQLRTWLAEREIDIGRCYDPRDQVRRVLNAAPDGLLKAAIEASEQLNAFVHAMATATGER